MNHSLKNLLSLALVLSSFLGISQCNPYFDINEGSTWSYENFNHKDKLQGSQTQTVSSYEKSSNGYEALLAVVSRDKKGKEIGNGELEIICENGILKFDMRRFVPEEQMQAMENFAVEVEGNNLEYPAELSAGMNLPDGDITVTAVGTAVSMNINVEITERKVVGSETVSTPAGDFEAFKITSKSTVTSKMGMSLTFEFDQIEWITRGVGMVRSESYRKDKLQGYTVLTSSNN